MITFLNYFLNWVTDPSFSDISYNNSRAFPAPYTRADQSIPYNKFYYFLKEPPPGTFGIQADGNINSMHLLQEKLVQQIVKQTLGLWVLLHNWLWVYGWGWMIQLSHSEKSNSVLKLHYQFLPTQCGILLN